MKHMKRKFQAHTGFCEVPKKKSETRSALIHFNTVDPAKEVNCGIRRDVIKSACVVKIDGSPSETNFSFNLVQIIKN